MDRIRGGLFGALFVSSALLLLGPSREPLVDLDLAAARLCVALHWSRAGSSSRSTRCSWRLRRKPEGIAGRTELIDLTTRSGREALIGTGPEVLAAPAPGQRGLPAPQRDWELAFPALPEALEGFTIVQLTDLHLAPCYGLPFFEHVIEACRDWPADLMVITGDLVEDDQVIPWIEPVLEPLEGRLGKFAILGNHDNECHPRRILECPGGSGIRVAGRALGRCRGQRLDASPWEARSTPGARPPTRPRSRRPTSGSCSATAPTCSTGPAGGAST